jgi:osmotically-inducible protein OsmY
VANHPQNGGRNVAVPDENRPSWRPQDQSASSSSRGRGNDDDQDQRSWRDRNYRDDDRQASDRDPRRWEGSRGSELGYPEDRDGGRSTERYGQGQSGYGAGRHGDDRSQQMQNRNEMVASSGGFEDRYHELGTDERFSGRGAGSWTDRSERGGYDPERYGAPGGYGGGRGFEAERIGSGRGVDQRGYGQGGHDQRGYGQGGQRMGGRMGGYEQRMGYQDGFRQGAQHMGYPSDPSGRGDAGYGAPWQGTPDAQRFDATAHVHGTTGPHRGKGPLGYQRSDERIREAVCEALADDDQIDASQIDVAVKDGEVTLSGTVDNRRVKREAEDCVSTVSGVRDVQIQLRVKDERAADRRSGMSGSGTGSSSMGQPGTSQPGTSQSSSSQAGTGASMRDNHGSGSSAGKSEPEGTSQDKKHRA